jgi:phosphoglycolate phosphatase-like HAD superfamily hydrolase
VIAAVIFDLDGTLINLPIDYEKFEAEIKKISKKNNIKPITKTITNLDGDLKSKVFEVWTELEFKAWKKSSINQKGIDLYKKYLELPKALVTMQGQKLVGEISTNLKLSFKFVVTRETSLDRVQQLKIVKDKLDLDFQNILFVGNTDGDEKAAKTVKCQFVRVLP